MSKNKSKKTKIIVSIVFLSITILFLSCKRQEFSREVRALYGTVVSIPSNLEIKQQNNYIEKVSDINYATIIIWYDSTHCASCNLNFINRWNYMNIASIPQMEYNL